jgi:hypothetical protein
VGPSGEAGAQFSGFSKNAQKEGNHANKGVEDDA